MHESLDFPVQQFHLYMLTRKNIHGVHCKWHVMYIHTVQPGNTSKVLSIISRNFFMLAATFWGRSSGLVTSLATSSGVISSRSSSSFEKSHMTDLTFLSLANYTLPLKSKLELLTWDSILTSQNSICLSFEKLAFLNIHHSKGSLFFFFLVYLPKFSTVGKLSWDTSTALLWSLHTNPSKFDLVPNVMNWVKIRRTCMESSQKHNWTNISRTICPGMLIFGK